MRTTQGQPHLWSVHPEEPYRTCGAWKGSETVLSPLSLLRMRRLYEDGRTNILFVGRVIPNKKIDDLIRVFALYQRLFDRNCRLLLVR